jgi:ATP-dependent RNA helicase DBP3
MDESLDEIEKKKKERKAAKREARAAAAAAAAAAALTETAPAQAEFEETHESIPSSAPINKKKRSREETESTIPVTDTSSSSSSSTSSSSSSSSSSTTTDAFRSERRIAVHDPESGGGAGKWDPIISFKQLESLAPSQVRSATASFKEPTPIQAQSWPILFGGRDLIGIAATGSGKTLAFALPGLSKILASNASGVKKGIKMLVLAPTRELAMQSAAVIETAGAAANVRSICVYGGVSKHEQVAALRGNNPAQVVVATPGRLLDLIQDGACNISNVSYLVLDEADRMLDMGFERDIRSIISLCPKAGPIGGRQTAMFSATWPPTIQQIAGEYLFNAIKVLIGSAELSANRKVTQIVEVIEQADKEKTLIKLLGQYHSSRKNRVIIFCLYKKETARIESFLQSRGYGCVAIHGDMSQDARTRAFEQFRDGIVPLLVATDVAARGLDIPQVEYVINLTFPLTIEDYVHRIGRTGRAGATGIAHTLFTSLDKGHAGELANILREAGVEPPEALLKFGTHVKKKEHALYGAHFKAIDGDGAPLKAPTRMTFD